MQSRLGLIGAVLAVVTVTVLLVSVSSSGEESFDALLQQTAEQLAAAKALGAEDQKQANADETRVKEISALLQTADADLAADERAANAAQAAAQHQAAVVAALRHRVALMQRGGANGQLTSTEEQYTAEQNLLLEQEASLKQQEQQLLMQESEESNLASGAEQQAQQVRIAAARDNGLLGSQQAAIQSNVQRIAQLTQQEQPVVTAIEKAQNVENADRIKMQNAMSLVHQLNEEKQARQLEAEMAARSKRRSDRDAAEQALNAAVAKEQALQNGPDHRRLKLKGVAAARLAKAQQAVKQAQAKLAAAYSESYSPASSSVSAAVAKKDEARYAAAEKAEDAATATVESDISALKAQKNRLATLQAEIAQQQEHEMNNQRLAALIRSRAGTEEADIAVITGRAASARELAAQEAKQVSHLEDLAKGVTQRIQYFEKKRSATLQRLTSSEMDAKKLAAQQQALDQSLSAAAALESSLETKESEAFNKVSQQEREIDALKSETHEDSEQAARFMAAARSQNMLANAALSQAAQQQQPTNNVPPPTEENTAPFPTIKPPAAV